MYPLAPLTPGGSGGGGQDGSVRRLVPGCTCLVWLVGCGCYRTDDGSVTADCCPARTRTVHTPNSCFLLYCDTTVVYDCRGALPCRALDLPSTAVVLLYSTACPEYREYCRASRRDAVLVVSVGVTRRFFSAYERFTFSLSFGLYE